MSEQFAFQQGLRECGTVDRDQRLLAAPAVSMDGPRYQFLTRTGLADNQNGCVGWSYTRNLLPNILNSLAAAMDGVSPLQGADRRFE